MCAFLEGVWRSIHLPMFIAQFWQLHLCSNALACHTMRSEARTFAFLAQACIKDSSQMVAKPTIVGFSSTVASLAFAHFASVPDHPPPQRRGMSTNVLDDQRWMELARIIENLSGLIKALGDAGGR